MERFFFSVVKDEINIRYIPKPGCISITKDNVNLQKSPFLKPLGLEIILACFYFCEKVEGRGNYLSMEAYVKQENFVVGYTMAIIPVLEKTNQIST
jgi:hypothetical protein